MHIAKRLQQATVAVFDAIYQRRAVRGYTARPVSEENVRALLDAAVQAPSAMNRQPWAFLVVQNRETLKRISGDAKKRIVESEEWGRDLEHARIPLDDPEFDIFYGASTLVVICRRDEPGFCPDGDCYLAGQNLMLAAHALGLATCPIGLARDVLQDPLYRHELGVERGYTPVLPIAVGYAREEMPPTHRDPARVLGWLK